MRRAWKTLPLRKAKGPTRRRRTTPRILSVLNRIRFSNTAKEAIMGDRFTGSMMMTVALAAAAASTAIALSVSGISAQTAAPSAALKTAWGEPDLQGIWTDEANTPFQRPAKYANQEFFTEAQ